MGGYTGHRYQRVSWAIASLALSTIRAGLVVAGLTEQHLGAPAMAQPAVRVRVYRWLQVQQLSGAVSYRQGGRSRQARLGDRLQAVGDGISTGNGSFARLLADTAIGTVTIAQNTSVVVDSLQVTPDNGHITRLRVSGGQVRVQVRPFTNPSSRLEIITPAGVSGVRGTSFGMTVQPNGKTGLATQEGSVVSSAQGQSFMVNGGFQNLIIPGEPPSPPVPIRDDPSLTYEWQVVLDGNIRRLRLNGQVDPVNMVYFGGEPQTTDRHGRFSLVLPMPSSPRYQIVVITPLGRSQTHEVAY